MHLKWVKRKTGGAANFDRSQWTHVEVPRAWDLFNEALLNYEGVGWYSTELAGGLEAKGRLQRLKFGRGKAEIEQQ